RRSGPPWHHRTARDLTRARQRKLAAQEADAADLQGDDVAGRLFRMVLEGLAEPSGTGEALPAPAAPPAAATPDATSRAEADGISHSEGAPPRPGRSVKYTYDGTRPETPEHGR